MPLHAKPGRILVIDDDTAFADAISGGLSRLGYEVAVSSRRELSFREIIPGEYCLIISELVTPGPNGHDILGVMRSRDKHLPVLIAAGRETLDQAAQAVKNGAFDFIPKTIKPEELDIVVRRALDHRELQKKLTRMKWLTFALTACIPIWILLGFLAFNSWRQ
ncbi:MAG: response regulator [Pseudomonadota bacterium]